MHKPTQSLTEAEVDRLLEELHIWTHGWVECAVCNYRHVSVHIAGTERVECPKCGHMTPVEE